MRGPPFEAVELLQQSDMQNSQTYLCVPKLDPDVMVMEPAEDGMRLQYAKTLN